MVRTYILTNLEKEILSTHLKEGSQPSGFRTLKHYIMKLDIERIETDLHLIKELRLRA